MLAGASNFFFFSFFLKKEMGNPSSTAAVVCALLRWIAGFLFNKYTILFVSKNIKMYPRIGYLGKMTYPCIRIRAVYVHSH